MAAKNVTLQYLADLIGQGQNRAVERWDDLKSDFDQKHKENTERRHALVGKFELLENRLTVAEGRVSIVETKLTSIVGDNSGGSGLLHEIRDTVAGLKTEVASIKQTVEDTPDIKKWVYGAIAVVGFLMFAIPLVVVILFEVLKLHK